MAEEVYMEPDLVRAISKGFGNFASVLKVVSTVLEIQMMILKTTAFIGNVGGAAVERYLSVIKPRIDELAQKCEEISQDVEVSVKKWEEATQRG